jgi:hypothetical protein
MACLFRVLSGFFLVVLLAGPLHGGEVYMWKDSQGNAHFTDDLTQVPASERDKVNTLSLPDLPAPPQPSDQGPGVSGPQGQGLEEEIEDPMATCQERIRKEVARLKKQLADDSRQVEEITRQIHRTGTSRRKNELQRERADLNERIDHTQTMLGTNLPAQARECRMEPDW